MVIPMFIVVTMDMVMVMMFRFIMITISFAFFFIAVIVITVDHRVRNITMQDLGHNSNANGSRQKTANHGEGCCLCRHSASLKIILG